MWVPGLTTRRSMHHPEKLSGRDASPTPRCVIIPKVILRSRESDEIAGHLVYRARSHNDRPFQLYLAAGYPEHTGLLVQAHQRRQQPMRNTPIEDQSAFRRHRWERQSVHL